MANTIYFKNLNMFNNNKTANTYISHSTKQAQNYWMAQDGMNRMNKNLR